MKHALFIIMKYFGEMQFVALSNSHFSCFMRERHAVVKRVCQGIFLEIIREIYLVFVLLLLVTCCGLTEIATRSRTGNWLHLWA